MRILHHKRSYSAEVLGARSSSLSLLQDKREKLLDAEVDRLISDYFGRFCMDGKEQPTQMRNGHLILQGRSRTCQSPCTMCLALGAGNQYPWYLYPSVFYDRKLTLFPQGKLLLSSSGSPFYLNLGFHEAYAKLSYPIFPTRDLQQHPRLYGLASRNILTRHAVLCYDCSLA